MGCGFSTTAELLKESKALKIKWEQVPELYKDIAWEDDNGKVWFPSVVTIPDQGIVFVDGTTKEDWKWAGVLMTDIPKEDQWRFPGEKTKTDMSTRKLFEQRDFIEALEYIGFFKVQ